MKSLAILGSTGSIGRNAIRVATRFPERFRVTTLAARSSIDLLAEQTSTFHPELVSVFDRETAEALGQLLPSDCKTKIVFGDTGYNLAAVHPGVDTVVSGMVGAAGLLPTVAAIKAGKEIALANKETLVMAGDIVMALARKHGVRILPVDSEHSAVHQCLAGQRREDLVKIYLTASGGPFLDRPAETFADIQPADALKHPTWEMGAKITIDSATLMNKGLEVIEAKHLFGVPWEMIDVVVHPQSMVHSLVSFRDGAMIAQLGVPDMRGAIAYALTCPERLPLAIPSPDLASVAALNFRAPDTIRFPCLELAFEAGRTGGTLPAVLNAANEVAVQAFLDGRLSFPGIPAVIKRTMACHQINSDPELSHILEADRWSRSEAEKQIVGFESIAT